MDINLLKSKRVAKGYNQITIAEKLSMAAKTYNQKENGVKEFSRTDISKLIKELDISADEVVKIFFN